MLEVVLRAGAALVVRFTDEDCMYVCMYVYVLEVVLRAGAALVVRFTDEDCMYVCMYVCVWVNTRMYVYVYK